ncbi:MAG: type IV pilin [Candidatus Thermoplasmatota archaeon]|jgi:flagellin-like protein|nr:type IV pilin [Candidatus Thermoplasmatota archaeon]
MQTKKNDMGVSPVIAVILMVAITVVLAGVVFLWAQSFTNEAGGTVKNLNVRGDIDANGIVVAGPVYYPVLTIEVISGKIVWSDYKVTINGVSVWDVADLVTAPETIAAGTNTVTSNAGDTAYFSHSTLAVTSGTEYSVKVVHIKENKIVWEANIIAVA